MSDDASDLELATNTGPVESVEGDSGGALEINVIPEEIDVLLTAQPAPCTPEIGSLWHRVSPKPGALVTVRSSDNRPRRVTLSASSDATGWNPRWVRWSFAVRRTPESAGGTAVAAQDGLGDGDCSLTLLVLPGETRNATLEILAELDGETATGNYPFTVDMIDPDAVDESGETFHAMLRLRHPESRLLDRLPAIYGTAMQQDEPIGGSFEDRPFFSRFLRGFEDSMEPMSALLGSIEQLFDADTTPAEVLPWLATWVSLALDENWPELKRRQLIKEAVDLYRWRGTRRGLSRYLEIYAGARPIIDDHPLEGMRLGPATKLGIDTKLGDVPPHTFVVTLPVDDPRTVSEHTVHDIIESEKPAHTAYDLRIVSAAAI